MLSMQHQPTMQSQHDELSALFARNLTLESAQAREQQQQQQRLLLEEQQRRDAVATGPTPEPIKYSITQHYTHSAHLINSSNSQQQLEQKQCSYQRDQRPTTPSMDAILANFEIDATALSPAQLQLFRTADDAQKMRLIQLWQISPPSPARGQGAILLESAGSRDSATSLDREESLARMRYEQLVRQEAEDTANAQQQIRKQLEQQQQQVNTYQDADMSLDGIVVKNVSPRASLSIPNQNQPAQQDNGCWSSPSDVEPYMESGYEQLCRRDYYALSSSPPRARSNPENHALAGGFLVDPASDLARPRDAYSHFGMRTGGPSNAAVVGYNPAKDPVYGGMGGGNWSSVQQQDGYGHGAFSGLGEEGMQF